MLQEWWVWGAAAFIFAALEIIVPGFILLGFGIGAAFIGVLLWLELIVEIAPLLLTFSITSLGAWVFLWRLFRQKTAQVPKVWKDDINE